MIHRLKLVTFHPSYGAWMFCAGALLGWVGITAFLWLLANDPFTR